jgi:hypothetical protein
MGMTSTDVDTTTAITSILLDVTDPAAATAFYDAFGVGDRVRVRAAAEPSTGFRGFTLSLVVSQPADATALLDAALAAGATTLRPATRSLWGFGGVVRAPDGAIWKVATSSKKDTGPAARRYDDLVLLLGATDVAATKRFYVDRGLTVARGFGRKYVEFAAAPGAVKLGLYGRKALAKDAGVPADGTGSHRITLGSQAGPFADPDGFPWQPVER